MGLGGAIIWIPAPAIGARVFPPGVPALLSASPGQVSASASSLPGNSHHGWANSRGGRRLAARSRIEFSIAVVVLAGTLLVLKSQGQRPAAAGGFGGFGALRTVRAWVPTTVAYTAYGFAYILVIAFLVGAKDDSGFSPSEAALMFSLVGIAAAFGGVSLGALSDRIGRRVTLMGAFTLYAGCGLLALTGQRQLSLLHPRYWPCIFRGRLSSPGTSWPTPIAVPTARHSLQQHFRSASLK